MKTFLIAIVLTVLTSGLARAGGGYNQRYSYRSCAHSNTKECRDARDAFARHHNGIYPDQWFNGWYQGQQGRWSQQGSNWLWSGMEGDQWFQGKQGHWYQEPEGPRFRSDQGDEYRKGNKGWQWGGTQKKHSKTQKKHE